MIKLRQQVIIEKQGKYGWDQEAIYEPVWISQHQIESMAFGGLTHIKMCSGDVVKVKETPEQILKLGFGSEFSAPCIGLNEDD